MHPLLRKFKIPLAVTVLVLVVIALLFAARSRTYDPFQGDAVINPPFT